jgi:hypothetical protein
MGEKIDRRRARHSERRREALSFLFSRRHYSRQFTFFRSFFRRGRTWLALVCSAFARESFSIIPATEPSGNVTFTKRHNPTSSGIVFCLVLFSAPETKARKTFFTFPAKHGGEREMKNHFSERNKKRINDSECIRALNAILSTRRRLCASRRPTQRRLREKVQPTLAMSSASEKASWSLGERQRSWC